MAYEYTPGLAYSTQDDLTAIDTAVDAGYQQEVQREQDYEKELSKSEEKARRLAQTTKQKERELGQKPLDASNDDWAVTESAKKAFNSVVPHDWQLGVNKFGGNYNTQNKDFNTEDMSNIWNEVQDDPYGDKVMYYMEVEDGYEEDGITPKNMYKVGFADVSAYDRYAEQLTDQGIKIVGEKRFNSAEDVENRIHGNEEFLKSRAFQRGQGSNENINEFGSGSSELYTKDILGIAEGMTDEDFAKNLGKSKEAYYQALEEYKPTKSGNWARAFGSGALTLAGQVTKMANTELGQNIMDSANDITGYSDTDVKRAGKQFRRGIRNANPIDLIDSFITGGPEVFMQSLPEMLAVAGATALTGGGAAVGTAANVASKVNSARTPIMGLAAIKTNDTLDTRKELNGGQSASLAEAAGVYISEVIATGLDYGSFKFITGKEFPGGLGIKMPGKGTKDFRKMIKELDPESRATTIIAALSSIANAAGRGGGKMALASGTESAQEVTTELVRMLGEQMGTEKYDGMSAMEILQEPENQHRLLESASLGAVGGGAPGVVQGASSAVGNLVEDISGGTPEVVPVYQSMRSALADAELNKKAGNPVDFTDSKEKRNFKETAATVSDWLGGQGQEGEIDGYDTGDYQSAEEVMEAFTQFDEFLNDETTKEIYTEDEIKEMKEIFDPAFEANKKAVEAFDPEGEDGIDLERVNPIQAIKDNKKEAKKQAEKESKKGMNEEQKKEFNKKKKQSIFEQKKADKKIAKKQKEAERLAKRADKTKAEQESMPLNDDGTINEAQQELINEVYDIAEEAEAEVETKRAEYEAKYGESPLNAFSAQAGSNVEVESIFEETVPDETVSGRKKTERDTRNRRIGKPNKRNINSSRIKKLSKKKSKNVKSNRIIQDTQIEDAFREGKNTEGMNTTSEQRQARPESAKARKTRTVFADKIKEASKSETLFKGNKRQQKLFKSMFTRKNKTTEEKAKAGGAIRFATIAMKAVIDDVRSNVDRAYNDGKKTSLYASRQNIAETIGRTIYESYGTQLVDTKANPKRGSKATYIELGNMALALAEEAGYIEAMPDGESIADPGRHDYVDTAGENVDAKKEKRGKNKTAMITGRNALLVRPDLLETKGSVDNLRSSSINSPLDTVLGRLMSAMMPGNQRMPDAGKLEGSQETKPETMPDIKGDEHTISDAEQTVVKQLQSKSLFIDWEVVLLLDELTEALKTQTFEQVLRDPKFQYANVMFGLHENEDEVLEIDEQSNTGKKISKKTNALAILDAVAQYKEDGLSMEEFNTLFFTYFSAINTRYHIDEIAFNFQADNVFSRHVLNSSRTRETVSGEKQVEAFILSVAEELGGKKNTDEVNPNNIMHYKKPVGARAAAKQNKQDGSIQSIMNGINVILGPSNKVPKISELLSPRYMEAPATSALMNSGKSPMQIIMLVKAVYDIREAVKNNNGKQGNWKNLEINTQQSMGFDADTSGYVNRLLNMLGGDNHAAIFAQIKELIVPNKDGQYGDGYLRLAGKVKALIKQKTDLLEQFENEDIDAVDQPGQLDFVDELATIAQFLEEFDADMRNTSKYPLMNRLYGQGKDAMAKILASAISGKMFNNAKDGAKTEKQVREMIDKLSGITTNPTEVNFEDKKILAEVIEKALGPIFDEALNDMNSELDAESESMLDAYSIMYKAADVTNSETGLTMRSPFSVVFAEIEELTDGMTKEEIEDLKSEAYDFSIEKNKMTEDGETITDDGEVVPLTKKLQSNPNSQRVMPLHAMDSGILMLAYALTFKQLGLTVGSMSVHDAVYANPEFMLAYRDNYNKAAFLMAKHYDLKNETVHQMDKLIKELERTGKNLDTLKQLTKKRNELAEGTDARMAQKTKALDELENSKGASVFGTFGQSMESTENVEPEVEVETEVEPEVESTSTTNPERVGRLTDKSSNQDHKRRFQEVFDSGEIYYIVDTEATDVDPNSAELTEFYAQGYSKGKPVGEPISFSAMPSDKVEYEHTRAEAAKNGVNLPTLQELEDASGSNTRDSANVSNSIERAYAQMASESTDGIPIIVGHNFKGYDNTLIANNTEDKLSESEIIDSMNISYANQESRGQGSPNKNIYPKGRNTQSQFFEDMTGEQIAVDSHSAKVDVQELAKAMTEVGKDTTPKMEDSGMKQVADIGRKNKLGQAIGKLTGETTPENIKASVDLVQDMIDSYHKIPGSEQVIIGLENIISWIETGKPLNLDTGNGRYGFFYNEQTGEVTIPKDIEKFTSNSQKKAPSFEDIVRYMNHEIEHSVHSLYIRSEMAKPKKDRSNSTQFIERILDRVISAVDKKISKDGTTMNQALTEMFDKFSTVEDTFGQSVPERMIYILGHENKTLQMIEFVAIYRSNPEVRKAINEVIMGNNETLIKRFIKAITDLINSAIKSVSLEKAQENSINTLNDAMNNMVLLGNQWLSENTKDGTATEGQVLNAMTDVKDFNAVMTKLPYKGKKPIYFLPYEDRISTFNLFASRWIKQGYANISNDIGKVSWVKKLTDEHSKKMTDKDKMYYKTMSLVTERFEPGTFTMRTLSYMNFTNVYEEAKMRAYEQALNDAQQKRNRIDTEILVSLKKEFEMATKGMSKKQIASIGRAFDNSLIHSLFYENDSGRRELDEVLDSGNHKDLIDKKAEIIEKELTLSIKDEVVSSYPGGVEKLALDIATYYDTRKLGNLARNEVTDIDVLTSLSDTNLDKMVELIALRQLQRLDSDNIKTLQTFRDKAAKRKNDPMETLRTTSMGNYQLSFATDRNEAGVNQQRFENATGSHINFGENYEFEHFKQKGRLALKDGVHKWIIIQEADDAAGVQGIAARVRSDFGFVSGIASSVSLNSDGIDITYDEAKDLDFAKNNIVRVGVPGNYQYKILLSNDMLGKLEINDHVVSSMMKANGHNTQIMESQSMIKHMMNQETFVIETAEDAENFNRDLGNKKLKHRSYFVSFPFPDEQGKGGLNIDDYPNIMHHYGKGKHITNVMGMNRRVNLVNKNLEDQLQGYIKAPMIDPSNVMLHKWESYLRNLVTMQASHVVMGNPVKIANDIASNASILAANNVPVISGWTYGKEAVKYMPQMTRLRNNVVAEQFKLYGLKDGSPEYLKQEVIVNKAIEKMEKHPFYPAVKHGFIQSLSTDMLMKDKDNVNELQKRANKIFEVIDAIPGAHWSLSRLADGAGMGIETMMELIASGAKDTKSIQEYTKHVISKSKRIRKDEDIPAFLSEIFATPGQSEILRLGGMATLGADVVSKWILYKHTLDMYRELNVLNKGKSLNGMRYRQKSLKDMDKEAGALAVGSFINYMTNLPRELDMLKDVGIFMFPHFTLRVQKVIGAIIVNRMFGTGFAATTIVMSGSFGPHIFGSVVGLKDIGHVSLSGSLILPTEII